MALPGFSRCAGACTAGPVPSHRPFLGKAGLWPVRLDDIWQPELDRGPRFPRFVREPPGCLRGQLRVAVRLVLLSSHCHRSSRCGPSGEASGGA